MNNSNKNTLNLQLVLLSFFVFITRLPGTKQDDDNSSPCSTPVTVEDAKAKLQANGIAINKNYMAFTLAEAKLNFKNLITMEPMNFSSIVEQRVSPSGHVINVTGCDPVEIVTPNTCRRCSGITIVGPNIYPNIFNTIVCYRDDTPGPVLCGPESKGGCTEFVKPQDLVEYDPTKKCDPSGNPPFVDKKIELTLCCGCELL